MPEKLLTVELDVPAGIMKVNGERLTGGIDEIHLVFADGAWELRLVEHKTYFANGEKMAEPKNLY